MGEELAVEHGLAGKAGGIADFGHRIVAGLQGVCGLPQLGAAQQFCRRAVAVLAAQGDQFAARYPGLAGQIGQAAEGGGLGVDALLQAFKAGGIDIHAAVMQIGPAAFAGAQAGGLGLRFGLEKAHVLALGFARGARGQAVDAGRGAPR